MRKDLPAIFIGFVSMAVVFAVAAGLAWYFLVYNTAQGRCQRGDLGACAVVIANQIH